MSLMDNKPDVQELHGELLGTENAEQSQIVVSVIVCTYNRSSCLYNCLQSLTIQTEDSSKFEVLVVDNNSSDNTWSVAEGFANRIGQFRLLFEPRQGLSHARNRGWLEARGRYVAYIDDDAEALPGWISEIVLFIKRHSEVLMFGGPHVPLMIDPVPSWFPPEFGTMDLGQEERALDTGLEFIEGMNMVIRKDALAAFRGFHPDLGMIGTKVYYGEETQLQLILKDKGHAVFYAPAVKVRHLLPAYKMSLGWLLRSTYASGRCSALAFDHQRGILAHIAGIAYGCVYALRILCRFQRVPVKRLLYYSLTPLVSEIGALTDFFSRSRSVTRDQSGLS